MKYNYNQNDISTKIFDFIYSCSMHDAILQRAFEGEKEWVEKVENAKQPLRKYIDYIISNRFGSQEAHDACFIKTANEICKTINDNKPTYASDVFSFGNAQKLINMMVKHVYSFCYYAPDLRQNFRFCHCPLDSIMLKKVWDLYKIIIGEDKRKENLKNSEFFCQSWDKEGQDGNDQPEISDFPERYKRYQQAIRDVIKLKDGDMYPIEFDYTVWKQVSDCNDTIK